MWHRNKRVKVMGTVLALLLVITAALTACGSAGPAGPAGPRGTAGPAGPPGADAPAPSTPPKITVTPSVLEPKLGSQTFVVSGSGFVPGEKMEVGFPKAMKAPSGDMLDAWLTYNGEPVANETGSWTVTIGRLGDLGTFNEDAYTLLVVGNKGSKATCPIVFKAKEE
ncbi:MAG: hypothetical protein ABH839_03205 [Chloroflexota bacterium]